MTPQTLFLHPPTCILSKMCTTMTFMFVTGYPDARVHADLPVDGLRPLPIPAGPDPRQDPGLRHGDRVLAYGPLHRPALPHLHHLHRLGGQSNLNTAKQCS